MKTQLFYTCFFTSLLLAGPSWAQVPASSEPQATLDESTGQLWLLPARHAPEVGQQTAAEVYRNVAQRRPSPLGEQRNGYYQMNYGQDWGTGARLNRLQYMQKTDLEPAITAAEKATAISEAHQAGNYIATLQVWRFLAAGLGATARMQALLLD